MIITIDIPDDIIEANIGDHFELGFDVKCTHKTNPKTKHVGGYVDVVWSNEYGYQELKFSTIKE